MLYLKSLLLGDARKQTSDSIAKNSGDTVERTDEDEDSDISAEYFDIAIPKKDDDDKEKKLLAAIENEFNKAINPNDTLDDEFDDQEYNGVNASSGMFNLLIYNYHDIFFSAAESSIDSITILLSTAIYVKYCFLL